MDRPIGEEQSIKAFWGNTWVRCLFVFVGVWVAAWLMGWLYPVVTSLFPAWPLWAQLAGAATLPVAVVGAVAFGMFVWAVFSEP